MKRLSSGCEPFDLLLGGGYESDVVTTLFGPSGSGKTTLALLAALSCANEGKKVIFIDTEGGVSLERARQLYPHADALFEKIFFLSPTSFEEQKFAIRQLQKKLTDHVALIVIDSIAMLYRLEVGRQDETIYDINRELGLQVGLLTAIARTHHIPIILTNQVYSAFDSPNVVNVVGGDVIKYGSKCLVEIQVRKNGIRRALLRKHRSIPSDTSVLFRIENSCLALLASEGQEDQPSSQNIYSSEKSSN